MVNDDTRLVEDDYRTDTVALATRMIADWGIDELAHYIIDDLAELYDDDDEARILAIEHIDWIENDDA